MDAGCTVMYGFEDYKVHSKLCLVTRMNNHTLQHVALISTGNFNENTARTYTDLAYLTAKPGIVKDVVAFLFVSAILAGVIVLVAMHIDLFALLGVNAL